MIERRVLGKEALDYFRWHLNVGKTLSSLVLERVDLTAGTVWTWLPPEIEENIGRDLNAWLSDSEIYQSEAGPQSDDSETTEDLAEDEAPGPLGEAVLRFLQECLNERPDSYLVFEDLFDHPPGAPSGLAKGIDRVAAEVTEGDWSGLLFFPEVRPGFLTLDAHGRNLSGPGDGEVYAYVRGPNRSIERIDTVMLSVKSWIETGFLTKIPRSEDPLSPNQWITRRQLETMADRTELILIDAYDGEGWAAWSRT